MEPEYFIFRTSFAQERLWFVNQFAPGNPFYNIHVAIPLPGFADADVVRRALQEIVRRHEVLRTTFVVSKGELVQAIAPALDVRLRIVDVTGYPPTERERVIAELSREESQQPFNLATGPLLRTTLVRAGFDDALLLLTIHHIVSDGWSMDVFTRELRTLCQAFVAGRPSPLPDLPIQYADFATWQRAWLQGDVLERQLSYWRTRLASAPALLELPTDRPRPSVQSYRGAYQQAYASPATVEALRRLTHSEGATMFMAVAAAFVTLLGRYTGQSDIVIGTPIANRDRSEVQDLIGFFVNTLVLRTEVSSDHSFRDLLRQVRERALEAYQHQDVPFEKLVAELAPERHLSHSPIFQVMFVHQTSLEDRPVAAGPHPSAGMADTPVGSVERGTAKFDLTLFTSEAPTGHLAIVVEYNVDLFDDERMTRLLGHFCELLDAVVADPECPIGDLRMLTSAELARLAAWSGSVTEYPRDSGIPALVAARAAEQPHAVAVSAAREELSYRDLVARAAALSVRLRELGATPNMPIAVCLDRSVDSIVALLGVLTAGAAYLPLDPAYPAARRELMLADAGATIVITESRHAALFASLRDARVLALDDPSECARLMDQSPSKIADTARGDDLAYIMYTSGSTGRPKGVAIAHRSVVRLVCNTNYVSLGPDETVLQYAPTSFDASTFEIWGALLNGARLVVAPPRLLSIDELGALVEREGITTMWLTANVFQEVVEGDLRPYRRVRQLLAGGDVLSPAHVRRFRAEVPHCRLINGYGPTEGTTFTCCHTVTDEDAKQSNVPIGTPIANTRVRVLDRRMQPVPVGVPGELFIGGDGLAVRYWNADELTAERFVRDPWSTGDGRLYRTGDIVRHRNDGVLEFLGRRDHQVKVRGYRVELGEVEAALQRHSAVTAAAVVVQGEGASKRLVAHVETGATELSVGALRGFLIGEIPEYEIPSAFFLTSALPRTPSGKIDREVLSRVAGATLTRDVSYAAPATEVERAIVTVWQQLLSVDRVGTDDNFFELGGHSLLMVRAQRMLQDALRIQLPLVELFQYPTIRALADHVAMRSGPDVQHEHVDERALRRREAARHRATRNPSPRPELQ